MDFVDPASLTQRHCLEDSDDEDGGSVINENTDVFTSPDSPPAAGSNLIIAIGQLASIFAKSYLSLDPLPSCTLAAESLTVFKDKHFPSSSQHPEHVVSEVFQVRRRGSDHPFHLCSHDKPLNTKHCNVWCSKVMEMFRPRLVLVLTSCKMHQYFSPHPRESDSDPTHTLRALHSSQWELGPVGDNLEPPNTVIGEAAAVLTHCQLQGVPAAMLVSYSELTQSPAECVAAFRPVLSHSLIQEQVVVKSQQEAGVAIKKLVPRPRQDLSGLYT